jgi:hypothetical protein
VKAKTQAWVFGVSVFLLLGVFAAILLSGVPAYSREPQPVARNQRESMVRAEPTLPPQEADYGECTPGDPDHPVAWCSPFGPEGKVMYCDRTGKVRLVETCSYFCWEDVDLGRRTPYCISADDVRRLIERGVISINR